MIRFGQIISLIFTLAFSAHAADFKLVDGKTITGEPMSFSEQGAVIRQTDGKLSERVAWFKFDAGTLKSFLNDPKARKFVEPLIGTPAESKTAPKKPAYEIKQPPKPNLPPPGTGFVSALTTPIGLALLGILFVANLFAASEIAVFRNYPIPLVCGIAAVLPVLGPLVFLCLKSRAIVYEPPPQAEPTLEETLAPAAPKPRPGIHEEGDEEGPGLSLSARKGEVEAAGPDHRQEFKHGEFIFNRRFFETNLPAYFRVVPGEFEKDLVMIIQSSRGDYIGRRISRISSTELHLQVQSGGASSEAMIPFGEIKQVIIRHKDAEG